MSFEKDYYEDYQKDTGNGRESRGSAGIPGRDDDRKLFVGGLSQQTTDRELKDYFSKFGEIESTTVKVDPHTGHSRGFAFIVFSNSQNIDKLLASGEHKINQRKVDPKRVSRKQGKIFVGGLTPEITDADIKDYFSQYGTILEVQTPFDKIRNQRKNFCFITFDSKDVVYDLLKKPKQLINGKEVDVRKAIMNPESMGQGGRGGRGDGGGPWSGGHSYGGYGSGNSHEYGYGSGYSNEYGMDYGSIGGYDYGGSNNGYGYDNSQGGYGTKLKGGNRQFQRHQPY